MAEASRDKSYAQQAAEENMILDGWSQTWGIRVYPWYSNDKLKFSFIEIGSAGKGKSFDIYVNAQKPDTMGMCMDTWAYDILDGTFSQIIKAEKAAGEKYPKYYKIVTGGSGEKSVGIMGSDTPGNYVINAKNGDGKYCNIKITYAALRLFARRYLESYASRREELENIRKQSEKRNTSKHETVNPSEVEEVELPTVEATPIPEADGNTEISCILMGDVKQIKGMTLIAMHDPSSKKQFGTLYVKQGNPAMNKVIRIPVQKKGNDYLLLTK